MLHKPGLFPFSLVVYNALSAASINCFIPSPSSGNEVTPTLLVKSVLGWLNSSLRIGKGGQFP